MYPFKKGSFAPRNAWYVAAFAKDVGRELVSRTILNTPVVMFRKPGSSELNIVYRRNDGNIGWIDSANIKG